NTSALDKIINMRSMVDFLNQDNGISEEDKNDPTLAGFMKALDEYKFDQKANEPQPFPAGVVHDDLGRFEYHENKILELLTAQKHRHEANQEPSLNENIPPKSTAAPVGNIDSQQQPQPQSQQSQLESVRKKLDFESQAHHTVTLYDNNYSATTA